MRLAILLVGLALPGCAASGPPVSHMPPPPPTARLTRDGVANFEPGVTTADQVLQAMGPPTSDTVTSDGGRELAYSYGQAIPRWIDDFPILSVFSVPSDMVILRFHGDGTLAQIASPPA